MVARAELLEGLQCPRCGRKNTYVIRTIEDTEKVGPDTVTVSVEAGVCTTCDERLLDSAATRKVQEAVRRLKAGAVAELNRTGNAYMSA
jgi:YgiT-type zinc finger domain-containing protein